ncbi:DNA methylase N-4 [Aeromonas enteropelogenes]|uniref:site-specific DNA-methyltransferase (adenine-specific) n=1 Tax=Aeromonas sp. 19NY04SH05-1 TaxID=2920537 RepID=A0AAU6T5M3_9GAMM|nr:DNA methylase N-4 [Aeromonas enteropelogenes]BEE22626.1 DNA methylase N-4 [Aeromonas enteropelogenes]
MEKLKMHSPNLVAQNIEQLAALFPNCVTESQGKDGELKRVIDFDLLKQELSTHIVDGPQERYQLNWPGKREALLTANAPIAKTLRPCREESVNFDTTQNLFIEGDNLDALKLLQETYLGKVKMIYIDPPYNTGKDFIYEDDFAESAEEFLKRSNQKDEQGNRLLANMESNGRYHSDWLSMMYPRLRVMANLLADDGLLAVSINDKEVFQLGKLLDEIFGCSNRLACAPWLSEASGGKEKTGLRTGHEYLLIYFKSTSESVSQDERSTGALNLSDNNGPYRKGRELMKWGGTSLRSDRPNQFYGLQCPTGDYVYPYRNDGKEGHWRWGKDNPDILHAQSNPDFFHWEKRPFDNAISVNGATERWVPYEKIRDVKKSVGWSTWLDKFGSNADGTRELKELFDFKVFDTPKPTQLIKWFLSLHGDDNGIVMDFFSGSSATADAVMRLNVEDQGCRRFIMVQLPEPCNEDSEAFKAGYQTISEVSRERIRRAGKKISEASQEVDVGFRALRIDTSNMADVYYNPDSVAQDDLFAQIDNIKADRTEEDLLFQVMLDWGVDLMSPILRQTIDGKTVFFVDADADAQYQHGALVACFDKTGGIDDAFIRQLATFSPLRLVFRDAGFASDAVKINAEQLLKQLSPLTEVKAI